MKPMRRWRGEWDPPWKRQRRARGPPPEREIFTTVLDEEFSQIPPEDEEDLNQNLLGGDEPLCGLPQAAPAHSGPALRARSPP